MLIAALHLAACQDKGSHYEHIEPAHLEHVEGSELSTLTPTDKGIERTGILTVPVTEEMIAHSPPRMSLQFLTRFDL